MEKRTTFYKIRKELRISIKQTFSDLIKLKRVENKVAFNNLLLKIVPDIRKYIIKRIKTAMKKNHFPKNKYVPNDFIDQLFIEAYDHIESFSFRLWIGIEE